MTTQSLRSFSARTVLVTGATGFLGRHTLRALLLAGHRVVAVGLDPDEAQGINEWALDEGFAAEPFPTSLGGLHLPTAGSPNGRTVLGWVRMDLSDMGSIGVLSRALRGLDAIVHCAALSTRWAPAPVLEQINVGITRLVVMLAQLAHVPRLIHVSSPLVGVAAEDQTNRDEYAAIKTIPLDAAAASRRQAEMVVQTLLAPMEEHRLNAGVSRATNEVPMQVAIVRPQGLVGAGDPSVAPSFLGLARRGVLPVLRRGQAQVELTAVENVAAALTHLATTDDGRPFKRPADLPAHLGIAHPVYHLSNGEPMRVADLVEGLCLHHDLAPRHLALPTVLLDAAARLAETIASKAYDWSLGLVRWTPWITRYMVAMLAFDHTLSIARAKAWGYTPTVRLGDCLDHHTVWARAAEGVEVAEAVRLSLVHAAPLPDVREQDAAQRPDGQRFNAVHAVMDRPASMANMPHRPTACVPVADPIDDDQHRRLYGSEAAYGSGTLNHRVMWLDQGTEAGTNVPPAQD